MKWFTRSAALVMLLLLGWFFLSYSLYRAASVGQARRVFIERGTGARAMLAQLSREDVLPAPWTIILPVVLSGEYRHFKAGEYYFEPGLSPQQLLGRIARGAVVVHALTIPEGRTVAQVREVLLAEPLLTGPLPAAIAEGSLAPDTVHFHRGDSRARIIARLQAQQRAILAAAWAQRASGLPLSTPQEALVLASIVEKETGLDAERGRVAAVFINRLKRGMRLQSDPTVAYGIAPHGLDRPLTAADLKRDHAYNTYLRDGLPPGPICNPGAAALHAVLHPPADDALYFVATGTGGHYFARTLAGHNRNVARYRAALRAQR